MHIDPRWMNKHLLPMSIDDKRREPKMTPHLQALVNQVNELHEAGHQACLYAKEFTLWWICPLDCREKLTYECPWLADPTGELATSNILSSF
jgi:hypothetical protein